MKKLVYLALPLFLLSGCFDGSDDDDEVIIEPPPVFSADQTFEISLSGKQQVPNVNSMQMASATIELDTDLKQIRGRL